MPKGIEVYIIPRWKGRDMVYDNVYALANEIKASEEFKQYEAAKKAAFEDETNTALIKEYQKMTVEVQMYAAAGQQAPTETTERLKQLIQLLQMNNEAIAFLIAETRFNGVMSDVFRILTEAVDIKLDFLEG